MTRLLELFSGTHSVGKVAKELGYEVVSLDIKNADINIDILKWNYKEYPNDYFDIIWASPPCRTFSSIKKTHIGRKNKDGKIVTAEYIEKEILTIGLPPLLKTLEIIAYFKPKKYFIENPQTGSMKKYLNLPYYDVDYCKYSDWGYRKRTRIWTNLKNFNPKKCRQDCNSCVNGKHLINFGMTNKNRFNNIKPIYTNINERYRVPPTLIKELI
jgi:site-specific DNA-cytosine methylase